MKHSTDPSFPLVAPGGTRIDDGDKTKVTEHCVFTAEENQTAIRSYAQVKASPYLPPPLPSYLGNGSAYAQNPSGRARVPAMLEF